MNLFLLRSASLPVKLHLVVALGALLLGAIQLLGKKGTWTHKVLGRLWVILMLVICISSFWIRQVMPDSRVFGYSPIHLLSIFVLLQMARGVYFAKVGNIPKHRLVMQYSYMGGLLIAGAFTFYPGRLLYAIFFGAN
ncbi:putative membrane protein [Herbaspirillum sp. Sphag1AN]|uniref:DUF2306 domain-containing protein n=1 Tax=unclassified Herbaspirillum TaxID=2624150 RepID=UPI001611AF97|nr:MULTISPECIES: DUF2306 domain-containing protein [unclassified Herbaspirillum]MBB3211971.1 putative membrane protein [Herbaspirillum sp. Sphag1AN]MBB3244195.1 putative membrane protein [Herbaspirillum sp. Sphag64]